MKNISITIMCSLFLITACQPQKTESMSVKTISNGWSYQEVDGDHSGSATVPGTIHTDLLNNGQIEDPFYRTNEKDLQWIDKKDWIYTTTIELNDVDLKHDRLMLRFHGLDTYGDVYLNDHLLLQANNMHRSWDVEIKSSAVTGTNILKVYFHSPIKKGLELYEASPYDYPANNDQSENGGLGDKKVSVFTRKAGYHYGWDWGPRFVTSGIWRPVELLTWNDAIITDFSIKQQKVNAELAELNADIEISAEENFNATIVLYNLSDNQELESKAVTVKKGLSTIMIPFDIENPKLWWSAGLGKPNMYEFKIQIIRNNTPVAEHVVKTGLRSIKLVREKDEFGESFLFELNGVRVFAKGANYIPNDSFLPRVSQKDYEKVIADAVNANMNMLRVWGGGIYENDYFYELCDKNGLLVWQDFMFACSMYPGNSEFIENVKQEAIDNVKRLRNHPCLALWCGNNEINTAWHYYGDGGWGWKQRYTKDQREELQKAYLDIFHQVLPEVLDSLVVGVDYWPSSPQAGYEPEMHATYETTSGDMHYWGVWHGLHPFEDFNKYKSRFISEYGFQSFPEFETVKKYAIEEDFNIESEVMAAHQRSGIGNLRIKEYMGWEYPVVPEDFEQFLYMSHILQARGAKKAIEAHRMAMPYCMGTLYWQINDCWPVASWSSTDYYHNWKAMHYTVKKSYEPVIVTIQQDADQLVVYGVSDLQQAQPALLLMSVLDFEGNEVSRYELPITLNSNSSSQIGSFNIKELLKKKKKNDVVIHLQLKQKDNLLADNLVYLVKPKFMTLPEAHIETDLIQKDGKNYLVLESDKLVRQLYLKMRNQKAEFSDNYFDMLPHRKYRIQVNAQSVISIDNLEMMHLQLVK